MIRLFHRAGIALVLAGSLWVCFLFTGGAQDPSSSSPTSDDAMKNWSRNLETAQKEAVEKNRPILALFEGSDWCGWCIRLSKEVFSTPEFQAYAQDHLVLFVADYPMKAKRPTDEAARNEALLKKYGVEGFPTVLILDAQGAILATTGYRPGGGTPYVEFLKTTIDQVVKPPALPAAPENTSQPQPAAATPVPDSNPSK